MTAVNSNKMNDINSFSICYNHCTHPEKKNPHLCIILNKKALFTHPLIFLDLLIDNPLAIIHTNSALTFAKDEQYQKDLNSAFNHQVYLW